jgi:predicted DNA-binding antitoxin AbrB/MazE fold protein
VEVFAMKTLIRARYDGRVLVPEEPLDLQVGQEVLLDIRLEAEQGVAHSKQERLRALQELVDTATPGLDIPDATLRREGMDMVLGPLPKAEELSVEERIEALRRIVQRGARGVNLPDEALRRENIYEDRV